jgi:hypothetical protein
MCYQAQRTAWAKIQTVHVQLWWADLNLENRAWKKINNRTPKMKASSPEIQPFRAAHADSVLCNGKLHDLLYLSRRPGCFWVILGIHRLPNPKGISSQSPHFTDELRALQQAEAAPQPIRRRSRLVSRLPNASAGCDSLAYATPPPLRMTLK